MPHALFGPCPSPSGQQGGVPHTHPIFDADYQSKIKNRKSKIALPAADRGNQYNFVAVSEDGVGGDEFEVEAEAGTFAPLF